MAVKDAGPRQLVAALPVNKLREAEESAERPKNQQRGQRASREAEEQQSRRPRKMGRSRGGSSGFLFGHACAVIPLGSGASEALAWGQRALGFPDRRPGRQGSTGLASRQQRRSETAAQRCFCQVSGYVDNCTCVVETMDRLND